MTGLNPADIFDPDPARRPPYGRLAAEVWSLLTYRPALPSPESLPNGGGKPVLVVPAFLTGDSFTRPLRAFLARCGFRSFGWGLGINWGPTPRLLEGLDRRFSEIRRDHGKVALVGVSLGGLFARNLAYERAHDISHVATVASPFRLPTSVNLAPLVRLCARRYSQAGPARTLARTTSVALVLRLAVLDGPARTLARTTSCARHGDLYTRRRHRCLGQLLRRKFC